MTQLTIGALAQRLQCQTETIRFYEREGLLPPPARSGGNYRLYGTPQLERLAFIRRCRSLDMTLDEIRVLLQLRDKPAQNCREVNTVLDEHIQHVTERIAQLRALQRQLRDLQQLCAKEPDGCGILKELARDTRAARPPAASRHIRGSHVHRAAR
jgi:Cd(II)/Pb(II)-responsive transcriptional regulator